MTDRSSKIFGLEPPAAVAFLIANPLTELNDPKLSQAEAKLFLGVVSKMSEKQIDEVIANVDDEGACILFDELNRSSQEIIQQGGAGTVVLKMMNRLVSKKGKGIITRSTSRKCMVKRRINKFPG